VSWVSIPILLSLEPINLTPPSIKPFLSLELKALPKHLKYVYLDKQETFPIIIGSHLTDGQEENLMSILKNNR